MNRPSLLATDLPLSLRRRLPGRGFRLASGLALAAALAAPSAHASITLASGDPQADFDVEVLLDGLSQATDVAELPDGRVVITERLGDVTVVTPDGNSTLAGHINVDPEFQEQGLVGIVADPDFATNNTLYFFASADMNTANKNKVYKITLGADNMLDSGRNAIIDQGLAGPLNHNGGGLAIHDGKLFVAVGDTGHNRTPPNNRFGTCLNNPSGKILRVNLDGSIPDDNPLANETMVTGCTAWNAPLTMQAPDKRNFFWGFRNPYRFWIDPQTNRMWIGDVGETTSEEVSVSAPLGTEAADQGQHFGWPFREGTTNYPNSNSPSDNDWKPEAQCMGISPARECVGPVYEYGHSGGNNCIIGGLIPDAPEGCGWDETWSQRYFFGDNGSGNIWTLDVNEARDGVVANSRKDFARSQGIASFHMGKKGVLYFVEAAGGVVTKVTPKALDTATCGMGGGGSGGMGGMGGGSAGTDASGGTSAAGASNGGMSAGGTTASGGTATAGTGTGGTTGGTSATAGKGGTGTGGSTGGSAPATGGTGTGGASAGRAGSGGTGTAGGSTAGTSGGEPDDSGGCGCRVAGSGSNFAALGVVLGGLSLMRLRSRLSRRRKSN